jgi:GNAT superfamily N-acetyltransferase
MRHGGGSRGSPLGALRSTLGRVKVISLGYRTDLMLRRVAGAVISDRGAHVVVRTPDNPDFRWGNFLLFSAPPGEGDAQWWRAAFDREFPQADYLALGVDGTEGEVGDAGEMAELGVTAEVSTVLTATAQTLVPAAKSGPGVDIRALAGDDDWRQALQLRLDCTEPGALSTEYRRFLEAKVAEYRRLCAAGHGTWFGAFTDGRMRASAGLFGDGSGLARYQDVETHPAFRRQGLAGSLVRHAGQWGLDRGARTLVIVADPDYHAIRLYRALGFTDTERQVQLERAPGTEDEADM